MAKNRRAATTPLMMEGAGQARLVDKSLEQQVLEKAPTECLGLKFDSEEERRAHFTQKLKEKLEDPEFRKIPGFPRGTDEDILRLSDPPYYTACPNPFLEDFVRTYGRPYNPSEKYEREPYAVDTSVGKTDALYRAHGYHTKVPHLAIVPSILHYTKPGEIVLDGFCGSGMTGVAAQWCGIAPESYRKSLGEQWKTEGRQRPEWGARRVILGDLSPAATFIAAGYNIPFDVTSFARAARRLLDEVAAEYGWMYETLHTDGKTKGRINYTVWSEIFSCPECSGEVNFVEEALDSDSKRVADTFPCPQCTATLTKKRLEKKIVSSFDADLKRTIRLAKRVPVLINYSVHGGSFEKKPARSDFDLLMRIEQLELPKHVPVDRMMHAAEDKEDWGDKYRAGTANFTHVHHLFLPRPAQVLSALWRKASAEPDMRLRNALLFFIEQAVWTCSILNRYRPTGYSQVSQYLTGVFYVPSQISELSPWYVLDGKLDRLVKAFSPMPAVVNYSATTTGDCGSLELTDGTVDYVFTDPPFGSNLAYAELNFIVEAWHGLFTNAVNEAITSPAQEKGVLEYQDLMRRCFSEYYRVLKPGRWMTVVFSNSSNAVWHAIQEAMGTAGFIVADVRTLDKKQGSFNQVLGVTVNQDLVISVYKPTTALADRFRLGATTPEGAWAFASEHLRRVPVFVNAGGQSEIVGERTAQMLHDRMVAFHVQRGLSVPISTAEFMAGMAQRYPERDGMYFLPDQVAEYDRKRMSISELRQLSLFVTDEASAIQWVRQQLSGKPQSFQDLQPVFMRELQSWAKHEATIELRHILDQNFLLYDGVGPVPGQIHSYLSSNFKDLRNLEKDHSSLVEKARGRWFVPDPAKQADLERLRERTLLREFAQYAESKQRQIKLFRTEAVRAGFKSAYDAQDYKTIVTVAGKLPESVLQEDEKLLMYYDVARMRLGTE